ncbi:uncharacterized protein LOC132707191 [Cylas formicarius]|uniref:uncharacterized protein LOC132707191 n=1 Tax=Cylas formicarius TaxID=197179 RepID=UPI002958AA50|nr:uncharacterized protein LOC132707191 [Cylas formicarius]
MEKRFEQLDEFIKDDDKVVTVASFACDAGLSLEEAKLAIQRYVEARERADELTVTYVLNGTRKNGQGTAVSIVRGHELEDRRRLYEDGAVATVFSVQKAAEIDFNFVALADPFSRKDVEHPIEGSIVGKNCKRRTLKNHQVTPVASVREVKVEPDTKAPVETAKRNSPKKNGISNFFNKMAEKSPSRATESVGKVTSSPSRTTGSVEKVKEEKKIARNGSEKKRKAENKRESDKKRKRIMVVEDSESDDLFGSEDDERVFDKSGDEPEKAPAKQPASTAMRRKAVNRTYEDEEGFIVTRTEYVFEPASEDEAAEAAPAKVPDKKIEREPSEKASKGKKGPKKPSNQPTLMNFFSKK